MFSCSSVSNTGASSSLIGSALPCRKCRGLPGCNSLSFVSPKESKQRKGDPQSGPLRGSLKKLKEPENLETSRLRRRRTSKFFNPSPPTFSSPARTGWGVDSGSDLGSPHPSPLPAGEGMKRSWSRHSLVLPPLPPGEGRGEGSPILYLSPPYPVLAGLRSAGGSGNKFLDVRRRQSRLVSKNSADFEHRKVPEAKRRDPDCGSPFFCLLFFGEAKKSELPPGNPRHSLQGRPIQPSRGLRNQK